MPGLFGVLALILSFIIVGFFPHPQATYVALSLILVVFIIDFTLTYRKDPKKAIKSYVYLSIVFVAVILVGLYVIK
ncbi:putative membrane protein YfcA [Alkalicoccobacillus murimartini]|uniref:Membrane protein YfcA n=1 Tax=Alkalicoccobacillus murimartini TaxID=171685 RepID=A0ABT9YHZ6_9BACI|nr:putative membrane protein YfcA [Alkalicoccobacillus murimartini]